MDCLLRDVDGSVSVMSPSLTSSIMPLTFLSPFPPFIRPVRYSHGPTERREWRERECVNVEDDRRDPIDTAHGGFFL